MGRTIPSFRNLFEGLAEELSTYRRALRGEDKYAFDQIMNNARKHASSCSIAPTIDPMSCILLSMIIEQQKEIDKLNDKLKELNNVPVGHKIRSEEQDDNKMGQR